MGGNSDTDMDLDRRRKTFDNGGTTKKLLTLLVRLPAPV